MRSPITSHPILILITSTVLFFGCAGESSPSQSQTEHENPTITEQTYPDSVTSQGQDQAPQVDVSAGDVVSSTLDGLRQGMPYSEAREMLLASGWQAKNMRGQDRQEHYGEGSLPGREEEMIEKRGWGELVSCAGTGLAQCRFEFQNVERQILVVITGGEGDDPGVDSWFYE